MKAGKRFLVLGAFAVIFGGIAATNAVAQIPEASYLRVTEPLEIGGTVLQPATYIIRVLPGHSNRNLLQVTNEDRSKVFATVLSIPHATPATEEQKNTQFVYYPSTDTSHRVLRTWFAPDSASGGGHDIVYPERRAMELAAIVKESVVAYKDDTNADAFNTTELEVVTPERKVVTYVAPRPVMVAEARELPDTAGRLPLFATLGLFMLCVAGGIRVFRMV